jgi:hypothetical protein
MTIYNAGLGFDALLTTDNGFLDANTRTLKDQGIGDSCLTGYLFCGFADGSC